MSQVATAGEVKAHDAVMGLQESRVHRKVCRTAIQRRVESNSAKKDGIKFIPGLESQVDEAGQQPKEKENKGESG